MIFQEWIPPDGTMIDYILWAAIVLGGYLLGSIPTGLIVGKLRGGVDIRKHGSGNIGATNVLRTLGWKISAIVLFGDVMKAAIMVLIGRYLGVPTFIQALAGVLAVAGHCWSPYIAFRGGKGVAAALGAAFAISPIAALIGLIVMAAVVAITHYVSLGSLIGTALGVMAIIGFVAAGYIGQGYVLMTFAAVIVFVRHQENIQRLLSGTERKLGEKAIAAAKSVQRAARKTKSRKVARGTHSGSTR